MSRITSRPTTGSLTPWVNTSNTSNYTGTATPIVGNQAFSAIPANQALPTTGTGIPDAGFATYVGQRFDTSDGRTLTIVQNGTTTVAGGKLVQAPAEVTAFEGLAVTVPTATPATAGTYQVLVTNGSTVLNVNQFQQGYLIVASGTGAGQTLKIASHQAAANAAKFIVTTEDAIYTTLDATSIVSLIYSPYVGVVISNSSTVGTPVGVTLYSLTGSTAATYNGTSGLLTANGVAQYGFVVTNGLTACLIDNTVTNVGYPLGPSAATNGALGVATLTSKPQMAISGQTQTSAQYGAVYLLLG